MSKGGRTVKMVLFDNLPQKLEQIRTHEFYKPYIRFLKEGFEAYSKEEIPLLTYQDFMYFYESGSRAEYEEKYFKRRDRLNRAFLLYLIYGEDEYMAEICNSIWAICTEISWCLPAHLDIFPISEHRTWIDLFAAETAFGLAEIYHLIGDKLPERISGLILHELNERCFNAFEKQSFWWEEHYSNWVSVCAGSVGMAYMYAAPERFDGVKDRILGLMSRFLDGYGDDGCCPEGISYWDGGFSFFTMFADAYLRFTGGEHDILHTDKVSKIALCNQKLILRGNHTVSFSDGARTGKFVNIGLYSYLKENFDGVVIPEHIALPTFLTRASSTALRMLLWSEPEHYTPDNSHADLGVTYFPDAQWYLNKREKYSFAAKAGHNNEMHNHNDIGSFCIADDNGHILADIGAMEYTRQNFCPETRFTLLQNSSLGHSVPIIDGKEQGTGEEYHGTVTQVSDNAFELDIHAAYDADIGRVHRSFSLDEASVTLCDSFDLDGEHEIVERFVTFLEPQILDDCVKLGSVRIYANGTPKITSHVLKNHDLECETVYLMDYSVTSDEFSLKVEI